MRRATPTLAATVCALLIAGPALAEPRASERDTKAAGELVKKAIGRSQQGDHEGAIALYLQAYTIVPSSALLSNVGAEYEQIGKQKEALKYFCMYLDKDPEGANAPYATTQAKLLQHQLGNEVDDDDVCAAPRPKPAPAAVTPPSKPDDGQPLPSGPEAPRPSGSAGMRYAGLGFGLAGLAAIGFGAYQGVKAKDVSDQISQHKMGEPWPKDIRQLEADGQHHENLQVAFLIGGGVAVTTGIVLYVLGRPSAPDHERTALRVTPTSNGFAVSGRF